MVEAGSDPMARTESDWIVTLGRPFSKGKGSRYSVPEYQRSLDERIPIKQDGSEAERLKPTWRMSS
jgi:hypothetical protein